MKNICKKLALLAVPVLLYLAFFIAFEPNNYFGLKSAAGSTQPVARVKAYRADPGTHLILGDSRLAHFDLALANEASGKQWQNLAFGGASLRETIDLANYILDSGNPTEEILLGLSFYTLNAGYDTDRMSALEDTLNNPLAYIFNLEYNVNALTGFSNWLVWAKGRLTGTVTTTWAEAQVEHETGDWGPADYLGDDGEALTLHYKLAVYPATIAPKCAGWAVNEEMLDALEALAARCAAEGVTLTIVLPPMADNVLTEVCDVYGITAGMQPVLERLSGWQAAYGTAVLDYEWADRPAFDDDKQFFDGFHLDTTYGLPQWTGQLFGALAE